MAEQLQRHYEHDPQHAGLHSVIEDEGEQGEHHHHKSVLKKVKDKAKKIKDTIKKHGHGHKHEHGPEGGHRRDDIYKEGHGGEDEDEDEEMVNDPEVHGAPMYESTVIRSTNLPTDANIDVGNPEGTRGDNHEQNLRDEGLARPLAREFGIPAAMDTLEPGNKDVPYVDEPNTKIGPQIGLEKEPHTPSKSPAEISRTDYQSNVADTTSDGSHDQFAPQEIGQNTSSTNTPEKPGPDAETADLATANTMSGKIYAATTAATSTAISAKNVVASKLGYGGGPWEAEDTPPKQSAPGVVYDYAEKAAEKLAPVYESVAGAGGALISEVHGGCGATEAAEGVNSGGTVKGYLAEKLKPGDEDKALSEVITDAFIKKDETPEEEGRVRQSAEVTERLGPVAEKKREGEDALAAGAESSGEGVVDRLKDAVGAWLGKSTGIETARESVGGLHVSTASSASGQEGKAEQQRG